MWYGREIRCGIEGDEREILLQCVSRYSWKIPAKVMPALTNISHDRIPK